MLKKNKPEETITVKAGAKPAQQPPKLSFDEQLEQDIASGELLVSVNAVAAFYRRSIRTVCDWKACHADFPVLSGPHGVWRTCRERLERWQAEHPEKFLSREERRDSATDERSRRRW